MLRSRLRSIPLAAALLACGAVPLARADQAAASGPTAESLFWEGRRAADAGDLATACARFAESLALERLAGTVFNLAHCEDRRGLLASAWRHYREAAERMKAGDARLAVALRRSKAIEPRLPRLIVRVSEPHPPGLTISLDGTPLPASELGAPFPVDPGEHRLRVTADGRAPREVSVTAIEAGAEEVLLAPGPETNPSPSPAAPPPGPRPPVSALPVSQPSPPAGSAPGPRQITGWTLAGTGAGAVVLGAIAGGMVLHEKGQFEQQCPDAVCRDEAGIDTAHRGTTWGVTSTAAFAAGAALAAVGLVLLLYPPATPARKPGPQARWSPEAPLTLTW